MRFVSLLLIAVSTLSAQTTPKRPKLVLAIVVDQFRYDYLVKFRDQYNAGLSRLLQQGAVFTNAYYESFPTVTAIGHSTFLSGATPSVSGIVGNSWYDREAKRNVTSVSDAKETMLGGAGRGAAGDAASPRRMLVSTVGDELKMAGRAAKVIGISIKDRSAILPAGHMADGAYWFDPGSGNFVSSSYYFKALPPWVEEFNKARTADKYVAAEWKPIAGGAIFKTMASNPGKDYFTSLESTPYGNDLLVKFSEAAITHEKLGGHEGTDVLALSLSSNDYVGHAKGPDDPQVRDISIRTDRLLGELFRFVEAKVGMRNVLVVFTADHGVAPVPEVNQARKMPGGRIVEKSLLEVTEKALTAKYGAGKWVEGGTGATQWLNYKLIEEKKLSIVEVSETAAQALRQAPHIIRAYTGDQLRRGALTGDMFDQRVRNGYNSRSGGDVIVVGDPYYIYDSKGTSHGMPYQYDAHVPVIFMGEAIKGGRYQKRIMVNDIAPTLSTLLEVETPSGSVGRALDEILK